MKVGDIFVFKGEAPQFDNCGVITKVCDDGYKVRFLDQDRSHDLHWYDSEIEKIETDLTPEQYKFMLML